MATGSKSVAEMWRWKEIFAEEARVCRFAPRLMCWMRSDRNRRLMTWRNFRGEWRVSRNKGKGEVTGGILSLPGEAAEKVVQEGPKKCEKMI